MDARKQRGMQIAANEGQVVHDGSTWRVWSQTGSGRRYRVNPAAGSCSCPDHEDTGLRCKHVIAVQITMTAETDETGATTVTTKTTYTQQWTAYNRAAIEEKDTFLNLLAELCAKVPSPEQTIGRPRLPLGDMAFAAAYKVYSGFSSRRFSTDLRDACARGLIARAPHFNSVSNYMSSDALTPVLSELITASSLPLAGIERDFAVDSSGFGTGRYIQWLDVKHGAKAPRMMKMHEWVKAHVMVGVTTNIVTACEMTPWTESDNRPFPMLVRQTGRNFDMEEVSADKAYLSRKNLALVEDCGATPFVPFKKNTTPVIKLDGTAWARMYHRMKADEDAFLASYHKRSNVETTFSMIKTKFGANVRSKSETGQNNEVLCKVLAHNIVVVGQAAHEFGITVPGHYS